MELARFELVGHYAGKNTSINGHRFINGRCDVVINPDYLPFLKRSMARYQAYMLGSLELEQAKRNELNGLWSSISSSEGSRETDSIHSRDESTSDRTTEETTDDRGTDVDDQNGETGILSEGDGHKHTGVPEVTGEIDYRLREVVLSLDPDEPEHWTEEGLPSIDAVESAYGPAVTREDIEYSSEGWNRQKALDKGSEEEVESTDKVIKAGDPRPKRGRKPKVKKEVTG